MSTTEIILAVILALVGNEVCDLSPWLGRQLVFVAAKLKYPAGDRRQIRTRELQALIEERPGKLLKLFTGLWFLAAFAPVGLVRSLKRGGPRARNTDSEARVTPGLETSQRKAVVSSVEMEPSRVSSSKPRTWAQREADGDYYRTSLYGEYD